MAGVGNRERGFTLVEVLIAMSVSALLLGSVYSSYTSTYKSFRMQEQCAEAQQNARGAIQLMSRDIIMAGYSTNTGVIFANRTSLTIQSGATSGVTNISYSRYSGARIGRSTAGSRQAVAERVRRLAFRYKDNLGNLLTPNASGNVLPTNNITQILISVTAGTPVFHGYSGASTMETTLSPRNL